MSSSTHDTIAWTGGQSRTASKTPLRGKPSGRHVPDLWQQAREQGLRTSQDGEENNEHYSFLLRVVEELLKRTSSPASPALQRSPAEHEWQTTHEPAGDEAALRRGLTTVVDRAVPLLSEQDEHYLVERLLEASRGHEQDLWAATEHLAAGEGATKANAELGARLVIALYEQHRDRAIVIIRRLLASRSPEDIDRALRIIDSVEDALFKPELERILARDHVPVWLRESILDTLDELN